MKSDPEVSVVMPVYNGERHITTALDSLLIQTHENSEFIVVDDGSTDRTPELLRGYTDPRVHIIRHDNNLGISEARNSGIRYASGKYVAILDSDDFSDPKRLELQAAFLEAHSEHVMVCSWATVIRELPGTRARRQLWRFTLPSDCLYPYLLFHNCIVHSSVMLRRDFLPTPTYRNLELAADYDLWVRLAKRHPIGVIRKPLVGYRIHEASVSNRRKRVQRGAMRKIIKDQLAQLHIDPTRQELDLHLEAAMPDSVLSRRQLADFKQWLEKIMASNKQFGIYDEQILRQVVGYRWMSACKAVCRQNPALFFVYLFSKFGQGHKVDFVLSAFRRVFGQLG